MIGAKTHIVIGAGQAGGRAAQSMRAAGFEGRILLVGEEAWPPYERPPLSKELLVGDDDLSRARLHSDDWYAENAIDLLTDTRVTAIDRGAKRIACQDGSTHDYDRLLLATGARVRKLEIPGAGLPGVYYLRDWADTLALRKALGGGGPVVVIGGGFIGLEAAASSRKRGCAVTVLEAADRLMGRAVPPAISDWFAALHRREGVDVRTGVGIVSIAGEDRATSVVLSDGATVPADTVIIGIGIIPNSELASDAGLEVDNGIVVDEFGRTSDPDIFAAGDVANQPSGLAGRRVRLESYQNAQDQGMAVARNMCAVPEDMKPYEDRLWVWSDQYDVNLQILGLPEGDDRVVCRGRPEDGAFMLFCMRGDRIAGVFAVNSGREIRLAERLMTAGRPMPDEGLADTGRKLRDLLRQS